MQKKCFVISPIGDPGTDVREHADDVFEFIIKPAMDEVGMHVYRADHTHRMGRVTDQMFSSILTDELCIAILTFKNPNVFYELAIAQSAARPVIILIQKGQGIPFDVRDLRVIEYDLSPRAARNKVYADQIVRMISSLDSVNWKVDVPFGNHLSPLGAGRGELTVYPTVESFGTSDRWVDMLREASATIELTGMTLRWWTERSTTFRPAMRRKAEEGCALRVLLLHPDNPALPPYFANPASAHTDHARLRADVDASFAFFAELSAAQPNIQVRQIIKGFPYQTTVRNDERVLMSPLLCGQSTAQRPLFECSRLLPLYRAAASEIKTLWNLNSAD
jgi:hypothetical protein